MAKTAKSDVLSKLRAVDKTHVHKIMKQLKLKSPSFKNAELVGKELGLEPSTKKQHQVLLGKLLAASRMDEE